MHVKSRGQAVVEFGIIALLFTLLMFAVVDFGLLLNTWLSVSSASRELARNAAVGKKQVFLQNEAQALNLPSVSATGFTKVCCSAWPPGPPATTGPSAVEVLVEYYDKACAPWQAGCAPVSASGSKAAINAEYPWVDVDRPGTGPTGAACTLSASPPCHPQPDDLVKVTVKAHGAQVITPLVRPFFGCTNGANPNCNVALTSSTIMRFEGQEF